MSMPPRSRTGSGPLIAGLLIVLAIAIARRRVRRHGHHAAAAVGQLLPDRQPDPGDRPLAEHARRCTTSCSTSPPRSSSLVEGLIIYSAFRYRRKPGDDELPPQTHGNNLVEIVWTLIPTVIVAVLFVFSWQTLNVVDAKVTTDVHVTGRRRPLPVVVRVPRRRRQRRCSRSRCRCGRRRPRVRGRRPGPPGRRADPRSTSAPRTSSTPSTSRSSCSSATSCRGSSTRSTSPSTTPGTYRGQCAELCGAFHGSMVFDVHAVDRPTFDAWLAEQIDKANATPPPPPSGGPSGAPARDGRPVERARTSRSRPTTLQAPAGQPFTIDFKNDDDGRPAQRRDPGRHAARSRSRATTITGAARDPATRSPPLAGRRLHVRLHRPSEHDRHPHGPVGAPLDGDHHPRPAPLPRTEAASTSG